MTEAPPDRFQRAYPPAVAPAGTAIHLPFLPSGELLVQSSGAGESAGGIALICSEAAIAEQAAETPPLYLGTLDGTPCLTYRTRAEAADAEAGFQTESLRGLWGRLDDAEFGLAGYAAHLLYWQANSGFCSRCGHPTASENSNTWAKRCTNCGHTTYPPVSPAVLILIHDDSDGILLVHKPGWGKRFSILAGFVEPGESLEGCVRRESLEEAGLPVTDIVYRGSQPWPFPHQVMVGFTARCVDRSLPIQLEEAELDDGQWFTRETLPELPPGLSLSRQMIDAWASGRY